MPQTTPPAVFILHRQGADLGLRLARELGGTAHAPESLRGAFGGKGEMSFFSSLAGEAAVLFPVRRLLVFIGAAGIAVRVLAPLLQSKDKDPAVVVLDHKGRHAISLLSGHLGGGNRAAEEIAALTGGTAVITTATDVEGVPAADTSAKDAGLAVGNVNAVKAVNAALASRLRPALFDPEERMGPADDMAEHFNLIRSGRGVCSPDNVRSPAGREAEEAARAALVPPFDIPAGPTVLVTEYAAASVLQDPERGAEPAFRNPEQGRGEKSGCGNSAEGPRTDVLYLHPKVLCVGIGCTKGTSFEELRRNYKDFLHSAGLAPQSVALLASADVKSEEPGLLALAEYLELPLLTFDKDTLQLYPPQVPSNAALAAFGLAGVCEPAALAAAHSLCPARGDFATPFLLVPKRKYARTTFAAARTGKASAIRV